MIGNSSRQRNSVSYYTLVSKEYQHLRVPYQKGTGLYLEDYEVNVTEIMYEYHSQYLVDNSYSLSGEEGEVEQVTAPPPPTEPELDDQIVFDPKVTGIWDHLLALMTDDQKTQLKEQAKKEVASPSYRHTGSSEQEERPGTSRTEESATSTSDTTRSRGPSRSHPVLLGNTAIAAHRANTFKHFAAVMSVILPCSVQEAAALLVSPQWVARIVVCKTHEEVIGVYRLFHQFSWSERERRPTDPIIDTERGRRRYERILRRIKFTEEYTARYQHCPVDYGRDNFTSDEEEVNVEKPPALKYRPIVPGDFVLTFNVLALANSLESQFPHRSEYWWTQLPGNLDQACICMSMQAWVDQLSTCKGEESFLTTYNSFLDTTWQALQGLQQCMGDFPYQKPKKEETTKAHYMKNRTLLLHNQIVWGEGADEDKPVIPKQGEQSECPIRGAASTAQIITDEQGTSGGQEGDDPNERKPDANPPGKGDEAQDEEKKKEAQVFRRW